MKIDDSVIVQINPDELLDPPQYIDEGDEWERGLAQTYNSLGFGHIEVGTKDEWYRFLG